MTVLRELTGELSFQADTTGATRFDAAMERSRANLESLNQVSLVGFTGVVTKAWGLVSAAATAGSLAAAKQFINIETGLDALEAATGKSFGAVKSEIESILQDKTLKNLVTEIDLVNAALGAAQEEGATGESIQRFLKIATTLGIVAKKPVAGILKQLVTGEVEGILKLIGQLPLELQELIKLSGTEFEKIGLAGRRGILEEKLLSALPDLEKIINEQRSKGLLTFDELGGAFSKLTTAVGEGTLPAFQKLNAILIPFVEGLTTKIGTPESQKEKREEFIQGLEEQAEPTLEIFRGIQKGFSDKFRKNLPNTLSESIKKLFDGVDDFDFKTLNPFQYLRTTPITGGATGRSLSDIRPGPEPTPGQIPNNRGGDNIYYITVAVQGGNTDRQTGQNVARELGRLLGAASEQAKQATMIRGGQ